ncbi:hypothetical protein [Actinoallomurus iriomotensis]|uniref:Lipoprotein n=1 Tax=Actinoallomurus iriomotensis TaxID=478107 RepID=A0A9W6RNQ3_9ACTN|nr:hypothetical protein [Actinoallomurus iriomotensis]GLY77367.1 hypothetical protein Airi01_056340 [Actinoallomurus iriomotensis]
MTNELTRRQLLRAGLLTGSALALPGLAIACSATAPTEIRSLELGGQHATLIGDPASPAPPRLTASGYAVGDKAWLSLGFMLSAELNDHADPLVEDIKGAYRDVRVQILNAAGAALVDTPVQGRPACTNTGATTRQEAMFVLSALLPAPADAHSIQVSEGSATLFSRVLPHDVPQVSDLSVHRAADGYTVSWQVQHSNSTTTASFVLVRGVHGGWQPAGIAVEQPPGTRSVVLSAGPDATPVQEVAVLTTDGLHTVASLAAPNQ